MKTNIKDNPKPPLADSIGSGYWKIAPIRHQKTTIDVVLQRKEAALHILRYSDDAALRDRAESTLDDLRHQEMSLKKPHLTSERLATTPK